MSIRLDLGCGAYKKEGFVGIDFAPGDGVDHVLDLNHDPLPFDDNSVDEIYSSHCFEHLNHHPHVFREINRVCKEDARVEVWTPYGWTNDGTNFDHKIMLNEAHYAHLSFEYPDFWQPIINGYWHFDEIEFAISQQTLESLALNLTRLDFALKHMNNICIEFGVRFRVSHEKKPQPTDLPARYFSLERGGRKFAINTYQHLRVIAVTRIKQLLSKQG